jgi:hypothetical protein
VSDILLKGIESVKPLRPASTFWVPLSSHLGHRAGISVATSGTVILCFSARLFSARLFSARLFSARLFSPCGLKIALHCGHRPPPFPPDVQPLKNDGLTQDWCCNVVGPDNIIRLSASRGVYRISPTQPSRPCIFSSIVAPSETEILWCGRRGLGALRALRALCLATAG